MSDPMESPWPPPKRPRRLKLWFTLGAGVLALMVVAGVVRTELQSHFVHVEYFHERTSNMAPTIEPGGLVAIKPVAKGRYRPRRGDIVVFTMPDGWSTRPGDLASRVVGLPGQTVSCDGGHRPLVVDGTPLTEPYTRDGCGLATYRVTVPAGRLWVLGDNRDAALDSRQVYLSTRQSRTATVPTSAVVAARTGS
jgi:signal peptidase I